MPALFVVDGTGIVAERVEGFLRSEYEALGEAIEQALALGSAPPVLEHLEDAFASPQSRARVMRVGLPDRYVTHGKPALLREEVGFTGEAVADRVLSALPETRPLTRR